MSGVFGGQTYEAGTMIRFTYTAPTAEERYRDIFVLNPTYQGKMHGLDLKRMTPAQVQVLEAIFDPEYQSGKKRHQFSLVNDILRRMDPSTEIKNPLVFYRRFVLPFMRTAGDVYRTFYPNYMSGVQVIKKSTMEGHQVSPMSGKPLFKKI